MPNMSSPNGEVLDLSEALQRASTLHRQGKSSPAEDLCRKILDAEPANFQALHFLGILLHQQGRSVEALELIGAALKARPDSVETLSNYGLVLQSLQRYDEALATYDRAVGLKPDFAEAFFNRGNALKGLKRIDDALASYDRAIALKPDFAEAFFNQGNALKELKRIDDALASYDRAIALKPDFTEAFINRGTALTELKRIDEALACYDKAVALEPEGAYGIINRGICRLLLGRYLEGWADYELRWGTERFHGVPPAFANWHGEDLKGRRLLVFSEQGLGDTIQFSRYLPLLARRGCRVTFLTDTRLLGLLRSLANEIEICDACTSERTFDFQCALMSLPHRFGTDLTSIPSAVPYLRAEGDRIDHWRTQIGEHGFKIGIIWQGSPSHHQERSVLLGVFFPLAKIPGVRLISLQRQQGIQQLAYVPANVKIETLGAAFVDSHDAFADTAAVISNLDLVITIDTSIAHLSAALGKLTWITLSYIADWRWLLDREDSPWYPTVRLFRQKRPNDWASAFSSIESELRKVVTRLE
jgi:tetratricopeptide (TPR) repeat protein